MAENNKSDTIEIPIGKYVSAVKKNPWMLVSVVLFIVLVLFIIFGNGLGNGTVSKNKAGNNLVKYVNGLGQGTATLTSVVKEGALYKVTVNFNGQDVPVYVSLDGKYLIQSPVPLTSDGSTSTDGQSTATLKISDLNLSNYLSIGNTSAKVTVVEFSDFSCPFCQAASGDNTEMVNYMKQRDSTWEPIVTNLMKDYVDTGKVRFVYIYSMGHSGGKPASLVAWCLNDQNPNYFKQFYAKAFAASSTDVEDQAKMITLAKSISGVNANALQQCIDSKKYDSRFAAEQAIAQQVGAQGTPAFFVNDEYVAKGAQSYVDFKKAVDAALAK